LERQDNLFPETFKGARVPVGALFENLEGGATVEQFLESFPGVTRKQALAALQFAGSSLAGPRR